MLNQRAFTAGVPFVHGSDLWDGNVGLVDDEQEIIREEIQQGMRRGARLTAIKMP